MPYKDDLKAAHGRIAALEQDLAAKPKEAPVQKCNRCKGILWDALVPLGCIVIAVVMVIATFRHWGARGDCYIENEWDARFELNQDIALGLDHTIGTFDSVDEALSAAKKIKCSVNGSVP
jgi:hypothetical protein